jgi:L-ribulokinase
MAEHGASMQRVINGGGIPQTNKALNQIYANVLGRPVLVPSSKVTSLGSAIFAFLAAGTFKTVEEAQSKICPSHAVYKPQPDAQKIYDDLYGLYKRLYFSFGKPESGAGFGDVLPSLMKIAASANSSGQN